MEWIVSILLLIIGVFTCLLEGIPGIFFIIPAIIFSPIVLDFLYDKGILINNTIKWIGIFVLCIIGSFMIVKEEIIYEQNVEVINPMDGLVLNEQKIMTMDDGSGLINGHQIDTSANQNIAVMESMGEEINYIIEYYYDGILIESATETLTGIVGDKIETFKEKDLGMYKLSTATTPLILDKNNPELKIKVYYVKIETDTQYVVRYYFDGILDSSKTKYIGGMTGDIIKTFPSEDREGYVPIKTVNLPLKLSENIEENEIRVYYGFEANTVMDELGLVDGFAPAVLIKKDNDGEIIEQYECPYCGSIYNKELLAPVSETSFMCPFCEKEVLYDEEGKMYDNEGNEIEQKIDNPEQQKITEKYALDTIEHKIHRPLCYYTRKIPAENFRASNEKIEDLITKGYKICTKCNPE